MATRAGLVFSIVLVAACGASELPKTVDPHWVQRCEGSATNQYGLTQVRACLATAKGYENAEDNAAAATYYRRACDLGDGEACIDWSRLLHDFGNVEGARIALASPACDKDEFAGLCGWALVGSFERDDPNRHEQVRPTLEHMCGAHHVKTACRRLKQMGPKPSPVKDAGAPADAAALLDDAASPAVDAGAAIPDAARD